MNNVQLFWSIVGIASVLIGNAWLIYFKEYFKKSGEFNAIKENISEVTTTVEKIKSDLEATNHRRNSLVSLEIEAILKYTEYYAIWLNSLTTLSLFEVQSDVNKLIEKIGTKRIDSELSEGRVVLLVNDLSIQLAQTELRLLTSRLQGDVSNDLYKIGTQQVQIELYDAKNEGNTNPLERNRLVEYGNNLISEFFKTTEKHAPEINKKHQQVNELLRNRLFEIS